MNITGGSLTLSGTLFVGQSGNGSMSMSGGTASVSFVRVGQGLGTTGSLNLSGGNMTVTGGFVGSNLLVGVGGIGSLTVSGNATLSMGGGGIVVGQMANGSGRAELLGGVVSGRNISQGSGSGTLLMDGTTVRLTGNQTTFLSGFGSGEVEIGNSGVILDTQSFSVSTATVLTGNGSLTKQGSGTLSLAGASTYLGNTTVSAGTLLIANTTGSATSAGDVTVAFGAAFGGNGSLTGNLSVSGTLQPGGSTGVDALGLKNVSLTDNATLAININSGVASATGADLVLVDGDLEMLGATYLGVSDIDPTPTAVAIGTKFAIVNYTGTWNGGLFTFGTTLADGDTFTSGLNTWEINYDDALGGENFTGEYLTGSFITLTAVPEPSTLGLAAAASALLFGATRLRRRS